MTRASGPTGDNETPTPRPGSRADRFAQPLARHVVQTVAAENGVCLRPLPMRRTDLTTGQTEIIPVPCGATLASVCPACAEKARKLRMAQCAAGWHLDHEPLPTPKPPTDEAKTLARLRADLEAVRADVEHDPAQVADTDRLIDEVDQALADLGVRGKAAPDARDRPRRARSTRRRQDAPDLPRLPVDKRTVGRTFTAPDGTVWRPSLFLTLTCPSYGPIVDGAPVNPDRYDYQRAARDAIHFPKLIDRFWQNLRRAIGWNVQYFATLEPQQRLAPHLHAAIRGTIPRALLRQVAAATYTQIWWPAHDVPVYPTGTPGPVWDDTAGGYADPGSGALLPTWEQALDAIGPDDEPAHVSRFGEQVRADGVTANSRTAGRLIGYLTKYLTKSLDACHTVDDDRRRAHLDRFADALRHEPCAPTCPNWLRYGVQPRNARPGQAPGRCKGKAHRRDTLGFGGRRVLLSRAWSGKTLTDHKADRRDWIRDQLAVLAPAGGDDGQDQTDDNRLHLWELARPGEPGVPRREHLILRAIADRSAWRLQLQAAQATANAPPALPATDAPHAA